MPSTQPDDRAVDGLLGAVGHGDLQAFAALFDRTAPAVFGLLRGVLGGHDAAEEATARVYLHLWQVAPQFDPHRDCVVTVAAHHPTRAHRPHLRPHRRNIGPRCRHEFTRTSVTATSTSPLPPLPDHARASWCTPATVRLAVTDMSRSLEFYLALDCEIRSAADGWVLLHGPQHPNPDTAFVLTTGIDCPDRWARSHLHRRPTNPPPPIRLSTPDLRALRRRLRATGGPTATITRPTHAPTGEIEITDPDLHLVVIKQR